MTAYDGLHDMMASGDLLGVRSTGLEHARVCRPGWRLMLTGGRMTGARGKLDHCEPRFQLTIIRAVAHCLRADSATRMTS